VSAACTATLAVSSSRISPTMFFAEDGGRRGDAEVDFTVVGEDVYASFLGDAFFGDVHTSDDFDT